MEPDTTRARRTRRKPDIGAPNVNAGSGSQDDALPPREPDPAPRKRTPTDRRLHGSIRDTYQSIGVVVIAVGMARTDDAGTADMGLVGTGTAITERADAAADAWLELADQSPAVKQALKRFSEGSAVATLIAIHVSMVLPLAASRGVIPASFTPLFTGPPVSDNGR